MQRQKYIDFMGWNKIWQIVGVTRPKNKINKKNIEAFFEKIEFSILRREIPVSLILFLEKKAAGCNGKIPLNQIFIHIIVLA